jgi:hypothetical protein
MTDILGTIATKTVIASADYKSVDPAAVTLQRGPGTGLVITLTPSLLSGAGCTVTLTATDADTTETLETALAVTATGANVLRLDNLDPSVHRVTLTCVGSGTRTTLTYKVQAEWEDLTYAPEVYWDGAKYASSEAQSH